MKVCEKAEISNEERRRKYNREYQKKHRAKILADPEKAEKFRAYHREYDREYRALLIKNHLCIYCRNKDERTISGYSICKECTEKKRIYDKMRRRNLKKEMEANA